MLSIVIVAMGAPLGREGAPKQFGVVFGNLFSSLQKLSDEQRRLIVAIGAGAGMAAVYSVPLGGALFALEVLRGALALRLVVPALAAALIATTTASFVVPNAPLYTVPLYPISPDVYLWTVIASPFIGLWSVAFVRAIAWAYRVRPSDWRRFIAPPLVLAVIGLISIVFPELLGNGQDVAQLLFLHPLEPVALAALVFVRPIATVASVASGAPGGLFTPSLAAGALAGAALGQLWLWVHPGGDIGLYALLGAGAMLAASTQGPISSLVLMMELTGQARAFALPMITAIVIATATARLIEWRSVYEARLTDEEVAERLRRASRAAPERRCARRSAVGRSPLAASRCFIYCRTSLIESPRSSVIRILASSGDPSRMASRIPRCWCRRSSWIFEAPSQLSSNVHSSEVRMRPPRAVRK